jgi:hypothetical protein
VRFILNDHGELVYVCIGFDYCGEFHRVRLVFDDHDELVCV